MTTIGDPTDVPLRFHAPACPPIRTAAARGDPPLPGRGRGRRVRISVLASGALLLGAHAALAAPHDDAAHKLVRKAMYEDYVETNFADSGKKLEEALALCQSPSDCEPAVRARILCDLGVVEFALQRQDEGRGHFARAVLEDPSVALEPDFSTPDLQREFAAVKAQSSPSPKPSADAQPDAVVATPAKPAGQSTDCPPDFPGCTPAPPPAASCTSDDDCSKGEKCTDGACSASGQVDDSATKPYKRNWVSLAVQEDILLLPGANNACAGGTGYACFSTRNGGSTSGASFIRLNSRRVASRTR